MAKRNNLEFVYETLRDLGEVPAKQVMAATGLSNSATTDNLRRLTKAGRVERREVQDDMAPGSGTVVLWRVAPPAQTPVNPADVAEGVDEIANAQGDRPTVVPAAYKGDHQGAAVVELPELAPDMAAQLGERYNPDTDRFEPIPALDPAAPIEVDDDRPASVADALGEVLDLVDQTVEGVTDPEIHERLRQLTAQVHAPAEVTDALGDNTQTPARQGSTRPTADTHPDGPDPLDQLTAEVHDPAEVERPTGTLRHLEHSLHLDQATVDALLAADPVPDDAGPVAAVIVHTVSRKALTVGPFDNPPAARDWWRKPFNRMASDSDIALVLRPLDVDSWPTEAEVDAAVEQWEREHAAEQTPAELASDNPGDVLAYMQSVRPVSPAPVGDPEPPRRRRRTRASSGEQRDTSGFYRRGQLSEQIAAWMREHADSTYSPTEVAKALGAQTGSVGYAMDKLTAAGTLRLTQAKPKRYQATTTADAAAQ